MGNPRMYCAVCTAHRLKILVPCAYQCDQTGHCQWSPLNFFLAMILWVFFPSNRQKRRLQCFLSVMKSFFCFLFLSFLFRLYSVTLVDYNKARMFEQVCSQPKLNIEKCQTKRSRMFWSSFIVNSVDSL